MLALQKTIIHEVLCNISTLFHEITTDICEICVQQLTMLSEIEYFVDSR